LNIERMLQGIAINLERAKRVKSEKTVTLQQLEAYHRVLLAKDHLDIAKHLRYPSGVCAGYERLVELHQQRSNGIRFLSVYDDAVERGDKKLLAYADNKSKVVRSDVKKIEGEIAMLEAWLLKVT
jgi:hypothetical protein